MHHRKAIKLTLSQNLYIVSNAPLVSIVLKQLGRAQQFPLITTKLTGGASLTKNQDGPARGRERMVTCLDGDLHIPKQGPVVKSEYF